MGRSVESNSVTLTEAIERASYPLIARFKRRQPGERLTDDQEQAIITLLAMRDGRMQPVADMTGVSLTEVWRVKHANMAAFSERREAFKRQGALEAQEVFVQATSQVREKLGDASARDAAVIAGIYADKGAMLAGEGITVTHRHTVEATPEMVALLSERIRAVTPMMDAMEADFRLVDE